MANGDYTPQFDFDNEDSEIKTCMWCGKKGKDLKLVDNVCPECAKKLAEKEAPKSPAQHAQSRPVQTYSEDSGMDSVPSGSGKLIQTQAIVLMILGIVVSLTMGIYVCMLGEQLILPGVIIIIVGSVFSWIGMTILRGFGEMVESSSHIENLLRKIVKK